MRMQEEASIQINIRAQDLTVHPNHQWEKTKPSSQQRRHQVDDERCHQAAQPRRQYRNRRRYKAEKTSKRRLVKKDKSILYVLSNDKHCSSNKGQVSELRRNHPQRKTPVATRRTSCCVISAQRQVSAMFCLMSHGNIITS